jgi:hypothetical protein
VCIGIALDFEVSIVISWVDDVDYYPLVNVFMTCFQPVYTSVFVVSMRHVTPVPGSRDARCRETLLQFRPSKSFSHRSIKL